METNHDKEIEARVQVAAARAHRSLSSEEQALVRTRIKRDLEMRAEMRTLQLVTGDAPDSGFLPGNAPIGDATW